MIKHKRLIREGDDSDLRKKVYDAIDLISDPAADKYFNLLVDIVKRAIGISEELGAEDLYDAAEEAVDEGMIYTDDQWLIMRYFQNPSEANLQEAFELLTNDVVSVLEALKK